jgi:hypothetical protein
VLRAACLIVKASIFLLPALFALQGFGQSMFLPQQHKHQQFLERLDIMLQKNPDLNTVTPKTISRHSAVFIAGMEDSSSGNPSIRLSKVDQQNLQDLLINNAEYVTRTSKPSGVLKTFYNNPANFIEVNKEKFFLSLNPVFSVAGGLPKGDDDRTIFSSSVGLSFRTLINNNLGFYAYATRNNEAPPDFARERFTAFNAVPGGNKYTLSSDGDYQYWDVRAGVTFKALRFFDFQIGYDRNFIGNGYRSLYLSDFGSNYIFGKVNTRVWRFRYQHLYATLVPQFTGRRSTNVPYGRKVVAVHHLNINATRWLNLALFQALTISSRKDWQFMIPIIFYPVSRLNNNKPDNDLTGLEFKANVAKRAQFYGQLLLDNFKLKEITAGNGWWNNRFGYQLGVKYINVFNVDNLDLQVEWNAVRPYTYATEDSLGNYTHFNNVLAHPFGANFSESIAILRYQPIKKLTTSLKVIMWKQGVDSARSNFGGNIFKSTNSRPAEYGYGIPTGVNATGSNVQLAASFEVAQNLFIDATFLLRKVTFERKYFADRENTLGMLGIRMNLFRKEYDY